MNNRETKLILKKWRWAALISFMLILVIAYWLMQLWLGPKVSTYPVLKGELIHTVMASGRVLSPAPVEVTSLISGKVISIPVIEGQQVQKGDTLIILENAGERAKVAQAKSLVDQATARLNKIRGLAQSASEQTIVRAKVTLENAKKQYSRTKELAEKGYVSQSQLDDTLRNMAIAQSQLATAQFQARSIKEKGSDYMRAESALNQARYSEKMARAKLESTAIKALNDGIIISSRVEKGNTVQAGKTLMVFSPGGMTQLIAQVDEKNISHLKLGQKAIVVAEAYPGKQFKAEITYINPAIDISRGSVDIKLDVAFAPDYFREDMPVSVEIEVSRREDALKLSLDAIRDGEELVPWVMVVEDGRAQHRAVKLGVRGDTAVEILEGLQEGELVLPKTALEVKEGKRIRLAKL